MSKLRDLGKEGTKDWAIVGNTSFNFFVPSDDLARISTDTVISLSHKQKEGESLDEFKQRVAEQAYEAVKKVFQEFPEEVSTAGFSVYHCQ